MVRDACPIREVRRQGGVFLQCLEVGNAQYRDESRGNGGSEKGVTMDLTAVHWTMLNITAFMYGFNRTGIVGSAIVCTPLMLMFFTPGTVLGVFMPLLVTADLVTIVLLRKEVIWRHVLRAFPWAVFGVVVGWRIARAAIGLGGVDQVFMRKLIAAVLIALLAFGNVVRRYPGLIAPKRSGDGEGKQRTWFVAGMGTMAGITTMLANNGGPAWVAYLNTLGMRIKEYLATAAWLYFIQNLSKIPFAVNLGFITRETFGINVFLIPALIGGLVAGRMVSSRISKKLFMGATQILALIGALYLLLR